jgi:hypothetical protein
MKSDVELWSRKGRQNSYPCKAVKTHLRSLGEAAFCGDSTTRLRNLSFPRSHLPPPLHILLML